MVTLNGHGGSAYQMLFPKNTENKGIYWYGNALARRGEYIVFALDVSHRNDTPLYNDQFSQHGDDPEHENGCHPSIRPNYRYKACLLVF